MRGGTETILLVEDELAVRNGTADAAAPLRLRAWSEATDGDRGFASAGREQKGRVDLPADRHGHAAADDRPRGRGETPAEEEGPEEGDQHLERLAARSTPRGSAWPTRKGMVYLAKLPQETRRGCWPVIRRMPGQGVMPHLGNQCPTGLTALFADPPCSPLRFRRAGRRNAYHPRVLLRWRCRAPPALKVTTPTGEASTSRSPPTDRSTSRSTSTRAWTTRPRASRCSIVCSWR